MTKNRFIQIHWLASYPGVLLNRDEAGMAKRLPFGGAVRGRVSSQSLKRHWRLAGASDLAGAADNIWALQTLGVPMGVRTKQIVEQRIMPEARSMRQAADPVQQIVAKTFLEKLYGESSPDPKKRQALFFGEPEIAYLARRAADALSEPDEKTAKAKVEAFFKDERANLRALKDGAGLESALWGRMVTSDPAANKDAAVHVAHAFTVHALEREMDFLTAVDDLKNRAAGDDSGAAGVFDAELTSGLYYGYVVVDVGLLTSNLAGDREIAGKVVEHLIHLIAQVSPGAKKGSTAPYAWAECLLVEAGDRQPRTLANAFQTPVSLRTNSLLSDAVSRMGAKLAAIDAVYDDPPEARRQAAVEFTIDDVQEVTLGALATWAADSVRATGIA
jgi:CRISPR system Cascade subunit CasC